MSATVFRTLDEAHGRFGPCALAIGNFDGVHIGHQALLREAIAAATNKGFAPAVLTFHPHPAAIVASDHVPPLITTLDEKLRLLGASGVERILVLPFTAELAKMPPGEFVRAILVEAMDAREIVVGDNFRFGHRAAGNPQILRELQGEFGFVSQFVPPVKYRGEIVSSSLIRQYIQKGNVSRAARLLDRCFAIEGPVVTGQGVGSKQTVPTLNLLPVPGHVLPRGVYITETIDPSRARRWHSVTNVGTRPTFDGHAITIETFLLSPFDGDTPDQIRVEFRRFIRAEKQFPDPAALKAQIMRDVNSTTRYWRRVTARVPATPLLH